MGIKCLSTEEVVELALPIGSVSSIDEQVQKFVRDAGQQPSPTIEGMPSPVESSSNDHRPIELPAEREGEQCSVEQALGDVAVLDSDIYRRGATA